MKRLRFGELEIEWDADALAVDPIAPVLPLLLNAREEQDTALLSTRAADLSIHCTLLRAPDTSPADSGATALLYHGPTQCFVTDHGLVLWDGASTLRILDEGRRIQIDVHPSSIDRPFKFTTATVMMTLLLALRYHGYFHLHASAAQFPDGQTWVVPGESGVGKSTLALAMFSAGARWLSDDALLLRAAGGEVEIIGWARKIRLTAQTANAYPALRSLCVACPAESLRDFEVDPRAAFEGRGLRATTSQPTLIFPLIADAQDSSAITLNRAEAFGRLLHACAWVANDRIPGRAAQLDLLARLVDGARAFEVSVGPRILTEPLAAVAELRALLS